MTLISSRFDTVARFLPATSDVLPVTVAERLSQLYRIAQKSDYVFGSPLGPFFDRGRHLHVPRFVYFGPHTHDESLRLAFLAGFEHADLRPTFSLIHFVETLAQSPDLGQGLNLSFFPLVDVIGVARSQRARALSAASWANTSVPEFDILEKDARVRGYHGFVRLESAADDVVSVRLRQRPELVEATGVELLSSDDFEPWEVRWEGDAAGAAPQDGPLTIADDLPVQPFELTIRLPATWPGDLHQDAVTSILRRFIFRQRALQAYSQHL